MKKLFTLFAVMALLVACGTKSSSFDTETYTRQVTVEAYQAYDNSGLHVRALAPPNEIYKVSVPLEEGQTYEMIIELSRKPTKGIKEAKVISYSQL